jgi:hypothetical protein
MDAYHMPGWKPVFSCKPVPSIAEEAFYVGITGQDRVLYQTSNLKHVEEAAILAFYQLEHTL